MWTGHWPSAETCSEIIDQFKGSNSEVTTTNSHCSSVKNSPVQGRRKRAACGKMAIKCLHTDHSPADQQIKYDKIEPEEAQGSEVNECKSFIYVRTKYN